MAYNPKQVRVLRTDEFNRWHSDHSSKYQGQIGARLDLITLGHLGNHRRFEGLVELKWRNGFRVYGFYCLSKTFIVLLGGTKHAQNRDVAKAKKIRKEILDGTYPI